MNNQQGAVDKLRTHVQNIKLSASNNNLVRENKLLAEKLEKAKMLQERFDSVVLENDNLKKCNEDLSEKLTSSEQRISTLQNEVAVLKGTLLEFLSSAKSHKSRKKSKSSIEQISLFSSSGREHWSVSEKRKIRESQQPKELPQMDRLRHQAEHDGLILSSRFESL